ncbi:MAG: DUF4339 domain-containing protein, partial [Bacteriovoracaceae bacterium]|nr:DUF4339 domain-containing protein [Bacteriovoracaceae bacterium]
MWYYVDGKERKGPVDESMLQQLFQSGQLNDDSYVWKNGFANWTKIKDVTELSFSLPSQIGASTSAPSLLELVADKKNIFIRIGADRGSIPNDYGPFSIDLLKRLFNEKRINARTLVFTTGLSNWTLLGDFADFQE